jgi:hypothetical protein
MKHWHQQIPYSIGQLQLQYTLHSEEHLAVLRAVRMCQHNSDSYRMCSADLQGSNGRECTPCNVRVWARPAPLLKNMLLMPQQQQDRGGAASGWYYNSQGS